MLGLFLFECSELVFFNIPTIAIAVIVVILVIVANVV